MLHMQQKDDTGHEPALACGQNWELVPFATKKATSSVTAPSTRQKVRHHLPRSHRVRQ